MNAKGIAQESPVFTDASVLARGARVIFNSPTHVYALAVFTDGAPLPDPHRQERSRRPQLAGGRGRDHPTAPGEQTPDRPATQAPPAKAPQQQAAPVNPAVACRNSHQIPHIPTITQATPGSRSVAVLWTYPLLDPQDCAPSTYVVSVKLLSAQARSRRPDMTMPLVPVAR